MAETFAEVILPFPLKERLTYRIPEEMARQAIPYMKVIVPLGKNKQSEALITALHCHKPAGVKVRDIISLPDEHPVIHAVNFLLWQWIAGYYFCPEGDVLKAAIPPGMKKDRFKPKLQSLVIAHPGINLRENWEEILAKLNRAVRQKDLLIRFAEKTHLFSPGKLSGIPKAELTREGRFSEFILHQLVEKNILQLSQVPVSRLIRENCGKSFLPKLTSLQQETCEATRLLLREKNVVLLYGVHASGKTMIYLQIIREILESGKQVLYLVPEITCALRIEQQLTETFGSQAGFYHSGMSDAERTETWNEVYGFKEGNASSCQVILGTRSSVFLPFSSLGLVIVDDEHDSSYKQTEPSPRYHARDMAIVLGSQHHCPVLLGSATPSIESWFNAGSGKYGKIILKERFGGFTLPEIVIADLSRARKKKQLQSILTPELFSAIEESLNAGEQIILIQNRRGFASFLECPACGHIPLCPECNVNLTCHLNRSNLICHYCGHKEHIPDICPVCGGTEMKSKGFGTEKAETEIATLFSNARISRMDMDTASTRNSFSRLIKDLEQKETDILVGTQMATRSLESGNIRLAGILNADLFLNIPDFRSWEKAFQFFLQITGRMALGGKKGKMIIQTSHPELPFFHFLTTGDYEGFYEFLAGERKIFKYPPWYRLIRIILKHKDAGQLETFSCQMADQFRSNPFIHVLGPEAPEIGRVKGLFIKEIWIKTARDTRSAALHNIINRVTGLIKKMPGNSNLIITTDTDPV